MHGAETEHRQMGQAADGFGFSFEALRRAKDPATQFSHTQDYTKVLVHPTLYA